MSLILAAKPVLNNDERFVLINTSVVEDTLIGSTYRRSERIRGIILRTHDQHNNSTTLTRMRKPNLILINTQLQYLI